MTGWTLPWNWADQAKKQEEANAWTASKAAERAYERRMSSVAAQVERILTQSGGTPEGLQAAEKLLHQYAKLIEPWAQQSANSMLAAVETKNQKNWRSLSKKMGLDMKRLLEAPGVGQAVKERLADNIKLIKSLPLEAALEVGKLAENSLASGLRAEDLQKHIQGISSVTQARARVIARTEISKASTALTKARAESVQSEGYIWRTSRDGSVRPSHAAMEGKFVRWDSPVTLDGMTGHAGEFPNCHCYPEPVVPKEDGGVYKPALPTQAQERIAGEQQLFSQWERTPGSQVVRHVPGKPLPNVDKAVFDPQKLTGYSLNPEHPTGKDKARVFKSAIGAGPEHAQLIEKQIMAFLPHAEAVPGQADRHGARFEATVPVTGPDGKTVDVLTAWIYDAVQGKNAVSTKPRLLTIFIPEQSRAV